jgi:hypothetical protein
MRLISLLISCVFADNRIQNIFREDVELPDSMEQFFLRPMKYLHHELVPHEIKKLAHHPSVGTLQSRKLYFDACEI